RMGIAWLQTHQNLPMVSFSAAFTSSFPSSSLPEFAAIFTALLTAPPSCNITFYTDSAIVIYQFNRYKLLITKASTVRPALKINNHVHWSCFFEVMNAYNLTVKMIKVK